MRINIKATNIELTDSIADYFNKRLGAVRRLLDVGDDRFLMQAELGRTTRHHQSGDIFRAEVNLSVDGRQYRAESEARDLYTAIDNVKAEILGELKRGKEKRRSLLRRGGQRIKDILRGFYKKDN